MDAIVDGDTSDFEIESENSDSNEENIAQEGRGQDFSTNNESENQTERRTESVRSDCEDVLGTTQHNITQRRQNAEGRPHWLKKEFINPEATFTGADSAAASSCTLQTPLQ